jgi:hypothetical protein
MPWIFYQSTDVGAPVLDGMVGTLVALLDACLVNGYGTKAAAGWTKEFSGTNKAAYRMGSGLTRGYLRIDDTFGGKANAAGFRSMTDVDSGTDRFPTGTGWRTFHKSNNNADATVRPWQLAADDRTLILRVNAGTVNGNTWSLHYFGEFFSFLPGDTGNVLLIGGQSQVATTFNENLTVFGTTHFSGNASTSLLTDVAGLQVADLVDLVSGIGTASMRQTAPSPADGGIMLVPVYVRGDGSGATYFHGMLRGVMFPPHSAGDMLAGTTSELVINGGNLLSGLTFSIRRASAGSTMGLDDRCLAIQVSGTVPSN